MHLGPVRFLHRLPVAKRLEPPVGQPFRLVFPARNQPDGVLAQARRRGIGLHVGVKTVFIILFDQALDGLGGGAHFYTLLNRYCRSASLINTSLQAQLDTIAIFLPLLPKRKRRAG